METIKVLEVDQWTSTGNIEEFSFDDFNINAVKGGDSEAIRAVFPPRAIILHVHPGEEPPLGKVWYREGPNRKLVQWKANYDTSD